MEGRREVEVDAGGSGGIYLAAARFGAWKTRWAAGRRGGGGAGELQWWGGAGAAGVGAAVSWVRPVSARVDWRGSGRN